MRVETLPLDVIELPEWAGEIRLRLPEVVQELKRSIMAYGFRVPVVVARRGSSYIVLDGVTRLEAARELGLREVPCLVTEVGEDVEDVALFQQALDMNVAQAGYGPVSRLKAVAYLVRKGWVVEKACERVGVSVKWYEKYRPILELPREVQEQVERGELTLSEALSVKGAQVATSSLLSRGYSAARRPSGKRERKRPLECFICGKSIKARERAWRPFHRSCLEILDAILREGLRIERTGNHITAYCRRCNAPLFAADWDGVRWVVSTSLEEAGGP